MRQGKGDVGVRYGSVISPDVAPNMVGGSMTGFALVIFDFPSA